MKIDNENYKTDFFISGLADINNQKSFVVTSSANKNNKFDKYFWIIREYTFIFKWNNEKA